MNLLLAHIKRHSASAAIAVIAVGLLRAIFDDGFWMRELWYDEAFSGLLVQLPWSQFWPAIVSDVHPPLYYILLKLWGSVAGFSDIALRSLSTVFFGGFLWYLFKLVRDATKNPLIALGITLFFSQNPFFLQYAQEARMYMLLAFLLIAAMYFFQRGQETLPARFDRNWSIFSVLIGLLLLTHYLAWLVVPGFLLASFAEHRQNRQLGGLSYLWLRVLALPLFLVAVWMPFLADQFVLMSSIQWTRPIEARDFAVQLFVLFFGAEQGAHGIPPASRFVFPFLPALGGVLLLLFSLYLTRLRHRLSSREGRLVHTSLLVFTVFLEIVLILELSGIHLFLSRYLFFISPLLLLPLLLLVVTIPFRFVPPLLLGFYLCLTLLLQPSFWQTNFKPLTQRLAASSHSEAVFNNPFEYFTALFYRSGGPEYLFYSAGHSPEMLEEWALFRGRVVVANPRQIPLAAVLVEGADHWSLPGWEKIDEIHGYALLVFDRDNALPTHDH